ncbi:zinc ribbon domain-containing protein [Deinococcus hopiensis]|uniref:Transposase and inactivated derivatives n=1 Tax=Deinococcus hopiensis KR-140 TaxID=695939 RepID=A0A1W1VLM7_9DEIO|nr:zinc ribbon domain-containing protein [Deinococcus hopiensis]SMB94193.1 Transposase and inactivated derivatives [Deinococcus hopiensis KR-140]
MREYTTHHVIRVDRRTYPQLRAAVKDHQLQPSDENLKVMLQGQVYRPADHLLSRQVLLHDRLLQLGDLQLEAECYRLPEQEYVTLLTDSRGNYRQYPGAHQLLTALLAPMTPDAEAAWWERVHMAVAQGRQPTTAVDLVDDAWTPTAWLRDRTRLIQQGQEWFLILYFAQPPRWRRPEGRGVVGIDVGLRPLASAAVGQAHAWTFEVHWPTVADDAPAEVQTFAQILDYAAARAALEMFTVPLLASASVLVLEDLNYAQFQSNFPDVARRRAVSDWHQSWVRQRAYARRIRIEEVPAFNTSVTCSQCRGYVRGTRQGRMFSCPHGHSSDAHLNAARNLVRRYWGQRIRASAPREV